ncbi:MAG: hypothetical protein EPN47_01095 [Acidobacteria bacterium]|nr:MAG: hypothetical protein EPN47_01095 [Acidobacteriota bacterium]
MQKARWNVFILISTLALGFLGTRAAAAPQPAEQPQNGQAAKKETASDSAIYRVSYKVNEVENGKTINSRSYTMTANMGSLVEARIGSRVPYSTGKDIQYQDVGMNIDCTLREQEGKLQVHTVLDMTTLASKETSPSLPGQPVFGHMRLMDVTPATIGESAFVGSADDVASNRHYVIEVTVTRAE